MASLKKIRVRDAKVSDRKLFKKLFKLAMIEAFERGETALPTDSNVELMAKLFDSYVSGGRGIVLFVADVAVLMWGNDGNPFELSTGTNIMRMWGAYVAPEYKGSEVEDKLFNAALAKVKERGVDTLYGQFYPENKDADRIYDIERLTGSEFQEVCLVGFYGIKE